jgi:acetylornithine deacetylase
MVKRLLAVDERTQLAGAPWFSDAAHLASGGVPAVCLGPGSIDQAHTVDEFIEATELVRGAEFFEAFIRNLG